MRGQCERRRGNINVDGAGAEVFAGDGCSQGASFDPMAAISRRWRGGRIYNNTRTRERQRRKCVKPADHTTHSPPKTCSRPPARRHALPQPSCHIPAAQTHARRLRDARPPTPQPIPRRKPAPAPAQRHALPEPSRHVPAAPTTARRPHDPFPVEDLLPPPHNDTPSPSTFSLPHAAPTQTRRLRHAFLADLTTHSPPKILARSPTATRPPRALPLPHAA